ncbi:MAG: alcohol dehydrogenase catalytic domain-containing protein [Vicinamibacteria bacterium]|nr:alcohol dehydrogenase catalytic domain-containing protein [Vicinamibacteria bacterium]
MRGLWIEDGRASLRADLPEPEPGPGEAMVRVALAGVCGTDLAILAGYAGFRGVPGHEFVGVVEHSAEPSWQGRRVVASINVGCGTCEECARGVREHCARRQVIGVRGRSGAFAERLAVPEANLLAVPEGLADEAAVFAEPLAAALRVPRQVPVRTGTRALVVGDGRLGQLVARVLRAHGAELLVAGHHERKCARLREAGIDARVRPELEPGGFELVVEATGRAEGFAVARAAVRPRGTLVLKTSHGAPLPVDLAALMVDEVSLVGSRCGPLDAALAWLESGRIDPRPLVDAVVSLTPDAFDAAARPGALKVLIRL